MLPWLGRLLERGSSGSSWMRVSRARYDVGGFDQ